MIIRLGYNYSFENSDRRADKKSMSHAQAIVNASFSIRFVQVLPVKWKLKLSKYRKSVRDKSLSNPNFGLFRLVFVQV